MQKERSEETSAAYANRWRAHRLSTCTLHLRAWRFESDCPARVARASLLAGMSIEQIGVTIFNDFSARDIQLQEMMGLLGPARGKLENKSGKPG